MSFVGHALQAIQTHGLKGVFGKLREVAVDRWFDFRHGVETCAPAKLDLFTITGGNRARATFYQATRVLPLRELLPAILAMLPEPGAFVDLGCGKGRVLLVAAEAGFPRVRGVEFARELCRIARANWDRFQHRAGVATVSCEIIESDVATYQMRGDESVYFVFNPFDETILEQVLGNIAASVAARARTVLVLFFHPKEHYRRMMASRADFELVEERVIRGHEFVVYSHRARR